MTDLAILETFLQLMEQDVITSKRAEKSENCIDNDYDREMCHFFNSHLAICNILISINVNSCADKFLLFMLMACLLNHIIKKF